MDTFRPQNWPPQAEELHIFDPKGNALLILQRPLAQEDDFDDLERQSNASESLKQSEPATINSIDTLIVPSEPSETPLSSAVPLFDGEVIPTQQVQMRASARHLILASSKFAACLDTPTFSEGQQLHTEGTVILDFPEEDPDAMVILLNVIHGKNDNVPRRVSLDMLTKLATAIDYHQIQEAVALHVDIWIDRVSQVPYYTPEAWNWVWIFWVFRKARGFNLATESLQQMSDVCLEDADITFPMPSSILRAMDINRVKSLETFIDVMYHYIEKYSGPELNCPNKSKQCDAHALRVLIDTSAALEILPRPKHPYPGLAFKRLREELQSLKGYVWRPCSRAGGSDATSSSKAHGVLDSIVSSLDHSMSNCNSGLKLERFLPTQSKQRTY